MIYWRWGQVQPKKVCCPDGGGGVVVSWGGRVFQNNYEEVEGEGGLDRNFTANAAKRVNRGGICWG